MWSAPKSPAELDRNLHSMDAANRSMLSSVKRVIVFRALQLGDLLCSVPAFRALRHAIPQAQIALLSLPWARDFVARYSAYIDEFIEFPGFPGLPEREPDIAQFPRFISRMQERRFDLTIQMHGSGGIVNAMLELVGAKMNAGYCEPDDLSANRQRFLPYPDDVHEVRRHLRLMEFLGAPSIHEYLEFPLHDQDYAELTRISEAARLHGGNYVCLHAGARYLTRRYPALRLAQVGDHFASQGLDVVLTGSAAERQLTEGVAATMRAECINLAGKTSLGAAAALVASARIVITNDTGMSHLAAAVGVPSVVIVLSSDAARWAPLDSTGHPTILADVPCRPCEHRSCPIGFPCAERITSSAVIDRAEQLLAIDASDRKSLSTHSVDYSKESACAVYAS